VSLKRVVACIKRNKRFLITTHTNPEGDALGSELAFYRLLKAMGKDAVMINDDAIADSYAFLPGINDIQRFVKSAKDIKFDCFVILDCSDLGRAGEVQRLNKLAKPILNIDHHISNLRFGQINWIETNVSSTSEMVYRLYKKLGIPFDREVATDLYVGILTDTGSFHYANTSAATHKAVAELLKYGLDIPRIYQHIYEDIPFVDACLLSKIFPTLKRRFSGRVTWFALRRSLLKKYKGLSFDLTEHVLSFARAVKDVEVALLFKENLGVKNEIRINFRSKGKVDVNKIAQFFGGGGHKTASGCTVKGGIEEIRRRVLAKIKESLR